MRREKTIQPHLRGLQPAREPYFIYQPCPVRTTFAWSLSTLSAVLDYNAIDFTPSLNFYLDPFFTTIHSKELRPLRIFRRILITPVASSHYKILTLSLPTLFSFASWMSQVSTLVSRQQPAHLCLYLRLCLHQLLRFPLGLILLLRIWVARERDLLLAAYHFLKCPPAPGTPLFMGAAHGAITGTTK